MPVFPVPHAFNLSLAADSQRCVLLGACGTGMRSLGRILSEGGHEVVGTDDALRAEDASSPSSAIRLMPADQLSRHKPFDVIIRSPAVPETSGLVQQLRTDGTPCLTLHEAVNSVFRDRQQICVAGTHGKSSTAAILSWILERSGNAPGFFIGADIAGFRSGGRFGSGSAAVIESCEYSRSFCRLSPQHVVLTGIDRDHFDCYPDRPSEVAAYREFLNRLGTAGTLLVPEICKRSRQLGREVSDRIHTFGMATDGGAEADWEADRVIHRETGTLFCCHYRGVKFGEFRCRLFGRHNVRNAVAAIAMAAEAGVSAHDCQAAVAEFSGIHRRFEFRGTYGGMTLVDDYAHHPQAVAATLETARTVFPGRRIVAVFEPHQVSRTLGLFVRFADTLSKADEILMLPVFPAREKISAGECCRVSGRLVRTVNRQGRKAFLLADLDQVISRIDHAGRPGDVILTMGAGRTNQIHDELNRRLQRNSAA